MKHISFLEYFKFSKVNIYLLALVVLIIAVYYPAIDNEFLYWDDQFYVTANPLINNPSWYSFKLLLTKIVSLNYHPLTMISLWVNSIFSGAETASPFIITNILLHILNSLLVYYFLSNLSRGDNVLGIIGASIFALHPMHVESVVWVSERKDVLYSFFFLLTLISYVKFIHYEKKFYLIGSFILFIMASLSKAMAVSLVPCLMLLDWHQGRKATALPVLIEKIPFILFALLIGLLTLDIQNGGSFYGVLSPSESADAIPMYYDLLDRLGYASFANIYYLKNFIFPQGFSALHPFTMVSEGHLPSYFSLNLGVLLLFIYAFLTGKRDLVFGLGFYFVTIFLVLQLVPVGSALVAERYTYLPYVGLAYLVGKAVSYSTKFQQLLKPSIASLILLAAYTSHKLTDLWQNHNTVFSNVVSLYPEDPFSRRILASGLWKEGKLDDAIFHTEHAINNLGLVTSSAFELLANCYADKGDRYKATAFYNEAISLDSLNITARYHRGIHTVETEPMQAIEDLTICENSNNDYIKALLYAPRGRALGMIGKYEDALSDLSKAIAQYPNDPNSYLDRAVTYEKLGMYDEAKNDYQHVLRLDKDKSYASERLQIINKINLKDAI